MRTIPYFYLESVVRREKGGGLLVNVSKKKVFRLNKSATDVACALSLGPLSVDELVKIISTIYGAPTSQIRRDIIVFLKYHKNKGNITQLETRSHFVEAEQIISRIEQERTGPFHDYPSSPFSVNLYPTYDCNQRCIFCYAAKEGHCTSGWDVKRLSNTAFMRLLELLIEKCVVRLNIVGGEPTLEFDLIYSLLEKSTAHMTSGFATNGSSRDGIKRDEAKKLATLRNLDIVISIEAATASLHDKIVGVKGAFQKAIRSMKNLIREGNRVYVQTVATKYNADEIIPLMHKVARMGARGFKLVHLAPAGMANKNYWKIALSPHEYLKISSMLEKAQIQYRPNFVIVYDKVFPFALSSKPLETSCPFDIFVTGCEGGLFSLEVMPNGDVYPCSLSLTFPEHKIGNIVNQDIKELWTSPKLDLFRNKDPQFLTNSVCKHCVHKKICRGGCLMAAKLLTGDAHSGDPLCPKIYKEK